MLRMTAAALVVVAFGVAPAGQAPDRKSPVNLQGRLYRAVFSSGTGVLGTADLPAVPQPLRARLGRYLSRRATFKSTYRTQPDSLEAVRVDAKKRAIERAIVSLIETARVEELAAEFVAGAPIKYEWEGLHDGPLDEANHAENVLKKDPSSPLAPWFYVFIAQRQRVAFETYEAEKNEDGMRAAAKKYRAFVERARAVEDPIFVALVEDMERQPYLYLKGTKHPREYAPDS